MSIYVLLCAIVVCAPAAHSDHGEQVVFEAFHSNADCVFSASAERRCESVSYNEESFLRPRGGDVALRDVPAFMLPRRVNCAVDYTRFNSGALACVSEKPWFRDFVLECNDTRRLASQCYLTYDVTRALHEILVPTALVMLLILAVAVRLFLTWHREESQLMASHDLGVFEVDEAPVTEQENECFETLPRAATRWFSPRERVKLS